MESPWTIYATLGRRRGTTDPMMEVLVVSDAHYLDVVDRVVPIDAAMGDVLRALGVAPHDVTWSFGRNIFATLRVPASVRYLVEFGVDINATHGQSLLMDWRTCDEMYEAFLANGMNPNAQNARGQTPLHAARSPRKVQLLFEHKVDPTSVDSDGCTALCYCYDTSIRDMMYRRGVPVHRNCSRRWSQRVDETLQLRAGRALILAGVDLSPLPAVLRNTL